MMDELRQMARVPVVIFDRFLGELQRITRDETLSAPVGIEQLKDVQTVMVREIEDSLRRFRNTLGAMEAELVAILHPPRPSLHEEIKRTLQHLERLVERVERRDKLVRAWEDQPADLLVKGYRAALDRNEIETAETYEVEAERALRRKGDAAARQAFQALRAQAVEARLTPPQKMAKADLEEIERLKHQVTLATSVVTSTLKGSGGIAAVGAGWRKGSRLRLDAEGQRRTSVQVLPGAHPGVTAQIVDVGQAGVGLALPQALPAGAMVHFAVNAASGCEEALRVQGEVRWCRADALTPGRYLAGVRLISAAGDGWMALMSRLAEGHPDSRAVLEWAPGDAASS